MSLDAKMMAVITMLVVTTTFEVHKENKCSAVNETLFPTFRISLKPMIRLLEKLILHGSFSCVTNWSLKPSLAQLA